MTDPILLVNPEDIILCTEANKFTQHTQHTKKLLHPHAKLDRGWFDVGPHCPRVQKNDWDGLLGPKFEALIEYKSIANHYNGVQNWRYSEFAGRIKNWAQRGQPIRELGTNFKDLDQWLELREKEIDQLINSISNGYTCSTIYADNIGVNIGRRGDLLFNNCGHHRLSILKCLGVKEIPVIPVTVYRPLFER